MERVLVGERTTTRNYLSQQVPKVDVEAPCQEHNADMMYITADAKRRCRGHGNQTYRLLIEPLRLPPYPVYEASMQDLEMHRRAPESL